MKLLNGGLVPSWESANMQLPGQFALFPSQKFIYSRPREKLWHHFLGVKVVFVGTHTQRSRAEFVLCLAVVEG